MMNKMSDEGNDDLYDGMGDSSSDEQLTATDEVDFKVSTLFLPFQLTLLFIVAEVL